MKKTIYFILVFFVAFSVAHAVEYGVRTGRTGGTSDDVDGIGCASASTGDVVIVPDTSNSTVYAYEYDSTASDPEDDPDVLEPDDVDANCSGNGNWILQKIFINNGEIDTTQLADEAVTAAKLAATLDLSAKAVTLDDLDLEVKSSAPGTPAAQEIYLADGTNWDPANLSISKAYWVIYDGSSYVGLFDEDGVWYVSSIATPTLETDELNDTSSPHALTKAELKNTKLSNAGASADLTYTMPEHTASDDDWNFSVPIEAAYQVTLDVHANDQYYLNGTQMAAGEDIVNAADTPGEVMVCYSTEVTVYCESKYSNFAEATP